MIRNLLSLLTFAVPYAAFRSDSQTALLWLLAAGIVFSWLRPMRTGPELWSALGLGAALSAAGYIAIEHQSHGLSGLAGASAVAIGVLSRLAAVLRLKLIEVPWLANIIQGKPLNTPYDQHTAPSHDIADSGTIHPPSIRDVATILGFVVGSMLIAVPSTSGHTALVMAEASIGVFALVVLSGTSPLAESLQKFTPRHSRTPAVVAAVLVFIVLSAWIFRAAA